MQPKLIVNFDRMSEADFLTKSELINTSLTGNVNFPLPWPAQVPAPAVLAPAFSGYQSAYNAAVGGDSAKITLRIAARDTLTTILKKIAPYLELIAAGSVPMLQTSGYDLRQDITHTPAGALLAAPTGLTLARGTMTGVLVVSADALAGAGSFEVQMTTGDPTVEANWAAAGTFMHCSNIQLTGLTPGKMYSVRLRGIGTNGPGAWSPAVSLMAV
jgi:hypothetical protein